MLETITGRDFLQLYFKTDYCSKEGRQSKRELRRQ